MVRMRSTLWLGVVLVVAGCAAAWALLGEKGGRSATALRPIAATASTQPSTLQVMTANIRFSNPADGINAWPKRRELLVKTLLKYQPDLLGCQEVTPTQEVYLTDALSQWYTHYPRAGVGKVAGAGSGGLTGELLGTLNESLASLDSLYFRKDKFTQIDGEAGLVLPDRQQKNPMENTYYSLAVLRVLGGSEPDAAKPTIIFIDTHLRHDDAFAAACARQLRARAAALEKKYPHSGIVVVGDMNHDRTSAAYRALVGASGTDTAGVWHDAFDYQMKPVAEKWGTWHAFHGVSSAVWPSDLIFVGGGLRASPAEILRDGGKGGVWPTDHFLVRAVVLLK